MVNFTSAEMNAETPSKTPLIFVRRKQITTVWRNYRRPSSVRSNLEPVVAILDIFRARSCLDYDHKSVVRFEKEVQ